MTLYSSNHNQNHISMPVWPPGQAGHLSGLAHRFETLHSRAVDPNPTTEDKSTALREHVKLSCHKMTLANALLHNTSMAQS